MSLQTLPTSTRSPKVGRSPPETTLTEHRVQKPTHRPRSARPVSRTVTDPGETGERCRNGPPVPLPPTRLAYHGVVDTSLRQTLHQRGLRMTPQRQLVLDAVHELGHATPEQICGQVQSAAPAVNITTVYRTLDLLERLGLVRHTHLGHGAPTYSEQEHQHVHLVCHNCGTVLEAPTGLMDSLAAQLAAESGFVLDVAHVALSGRCADCLDEPASAGAEDNR